MNRTQSSNSSLMSASSQYSPVPKTIGASSHGPGGAGEAFNGLAELELVGMGGGSSRIIRVDVACGDFVFALKVTYNNGKTFRHGEAPLDCRKLQWAQKWRSRASSYTPSRFENSKWKGFSLSKVRIYNKI